VGFIFGALAGDSCGTAYAAHLCANLEAIWYTYGAFLLVAFCLNTFFIFSSREVNRKSIFFKLFCTPISIPVGFVLFCIALSIF